jgi:hypothetical protein
MNWNRPNDQTSIVGGKSLTWLPKAVTMPPASRIDSRLIGGRPLSWARCRQSRIAHMPFQSERHGMWRQINSY